jgi:methylated-DNA-[protein]-cysteine S-methyltransferase
LQQLWVINGVSSISFSDDGRNNSIPENLQEVVSQLTNYFYHKRTSFDFKLTSRNFFQKSVVVFARHSFWKTRTYLEQAKVLGDVKAIRAVAAVKNHCGLCCLVIALSGQMFRLQAMLAGYGVKVVAGTRKS